MKSVKWVIILFVLIFVFSVSFPVLATDTGLIIESLSDEEITNIIQQREFNLLTSYTPVVAKCFDVRNDQMIVIGTKTGDTAFIVVYDGQGVFQYGFKTAESGSFRVMWIENSIGYYSIRSGLLFTINNDGQIININRITDDPENSIYDRDVLQSVTQKAGTSTYKMTNGNSFADTFFASYKEITKTNTEGTTIIYDASSNQITRVIVTLVTFLLIISFIAGGVLVSIRKRGQGDGSLVSNQADIIDTKTSN